MPTISRYCINENDPEIINQDTIELPQIFKELTLGKIKNFLISNDGNEITLAF